MPTMLETLEEERVMTIKFKPDVGMFRLREECDKYFWVMVTKEDLLKLAEEIKALASN